MTLRRLCRVGVVAVAFGLLAGCGPIEYVNQVTRKASASIEAAKVAGADKYSPYYYTLAKEYLHKARVEAAAADFEAANRFGRKSEEAAIQAKAEALARAGKPIEQFHPNFRSGSSGDQLSGGNGETKRAPVGSGVAPLVDDSEDDSEDPTDGEVPPGLGDRP